jgi:class 3 adenylate cyclase
MATLGAVAAMGDLKHFARMLSVAQPARRPAAILFADLEASSSHHRGPRSARRRVYHNDRASEVTALGDEVNEAASIEACASGGRMLAAKNLIERLEPNDAAALAINPDRLMYTRLAELSTATEKARNDAPAIAVCEV